MDTVLIPKRARNSHAGMLRLIAVFKLLDAACLIAVGIGILKLIHTDIAAAAYHWILRLGLDPGSRHINLLVEHLTNIPPKRIRELGIGSFFYAGLFLTEGIGLLLLKIWAEWFTIVITGSLIPVEIYEIFRHPSFIKLSLLFLNVAIVLYLIHSVRQDRSQP